jgi:hypothetical protein
VGSCLIIIDSRGEQVKETAVCFIYFRTVIRQRAAINEALNETLLGVAVGGFDHATRWTFAETGYDVCEHGVRRRNCCADEYGAIAATPVVLIRGDRIADIGPGRTRETTARLFGY